MVAALYRRYRPESFSEMIGQSQVTDPLATAIRSGRINHAYLFSGPRGCGKTTSARILARCLNCANGPTPEPCGECASCIELGRDGGGSLDVLEIDAASHGGVEDARDLRERAVVAPNRDRFRIFIIDEAHMVTGAGFNALLKVVEEPPEDVLFIFATTEPEKVIGTIRSRTHHYPFRLIPPAPMLEYVEQICQAEGISAQPGVLPLVVRAGGGSARDTMSLLDQLMAGTDGGEIQYDRATQLLGFTSQELLDDTIGAFAESDAAGAYAAIDAVIQSGQDPRRFVEDLLERVRDLIVAKAIGQGVEAVLRGLAPSELARLQDAAGRFSGAALSKIADAVNATLSEMTGVTAPRLQLELMVARILVAQRAPFAGGGADADSARPVVEARQGGTPQQTSRQQSQTPPARQSGPTTQPTPAPQAGDADATAVPDVAPMNSPAPVEREATHAPSPSNTTQEERPVEPAAEPRTVTFAQIADAWPTVLERVLETGGRASWAVINQLRPLELDGETLRIDVPNRAVSQQLRHSTNDRPAPGQLLKGALQQTFGVAMRVQPRVRVADEASAPSGPRQGADDEERHDRAPKTRDASPRPGTRQTSEAPTKRAATAETPGVVWNVVSIPDAPVDAPQDGPGSAWDDFASEADDMAPEVIAARETAAIAAATEPEPMPEVVVRQEPEAGSEQAAVPEQGAATRVSAEAASAKESTDANPVGNLANEPATTTEWNVVTVPDAEPKPEPEPAPEPDPEPTGPLHPALAAGQERYGESVIRERLSARFVGEEPIEIAGPSSPIDGDIPPSDFEAPPEDY